MRADKRKAGQAKENLKHPKRAGYAALNKLALRALAHAQLVQRGIASPFGVRSFF